MPKRFRTSLLVTVVLIHVFWSAPGCTNATPRLSTMYLPLVADPTFASSSTYNSMIAQLEAAIERNEYDVNAYSKRALVLAKAGKMPEAERDLTAAINILRKNSAVHSKQLSEVYVQRGIVYWASKKVDQAIADYTKALQYDPDNWEALFHRWQAYRYVNDVRAERDRLRGMKIKPEVFEVEYSFDAGVI